MYDIIILGAGPGGYVAAIKAAQLGAKVALIEKDSLGGVCLNHGCIPTKSLIKSAITYHTLKHAKNYGVSCENISFNLEDIIKRKDDIVKKLNGGIAYLLKKNNVCVYSGYGKIISKNEVEVNKEIIKTKNIIIAAGSRPIIPPIPGAKESKYLLTSKEILNLKELPNKLTIIGGGIIGVEFANIFSALGSEVTIIERLPSILTSIDEEIVKYYLRSLKKNGVTVLTNSNVTLIKDNLVTYVKNEKEEILESNLILMAVGRRANIEDYKDLVKVENGYVQTDGYLRTNIPNIYAIGDINGKYMLAHVASHEGIIAVEHILGKNPNPVDYRKVPTCVYGIKEIAGIGLTEQEVVKENKEYKVSKIPISAIGKALADGENEGFIKVITDSDKNILGVWIYSYLATELISTFSVSIANNLTAKEMINAVIAHPTLSELSFEALLDAVSKAIHI